jgi:hypothetical protein
MDDVKLFDVSEQDIPSQTLTVTIKPKTRSSSAVDGELARRASPVTNRF